MRHIAFARRPSWSRAAAAPLFAFLTLGLSGAQCVGDPVPGPVVDPGTELATCTESAQCPLGNICAAGACVVGECDPLLEAACDTEGLESPFCCKVWEICAQGPIATVCANDPEQRGIGCSADDVSCTPCEVQEDCGAGQFCSGAACFEAAGRTSCTSSFQCPGGERCDRTVFLCVPDRGGCTFCGPDFPELCCEEDQVCSEQSGFCQDVPEPECDDDTPCSPGLICDDLQRCVQCREDAECGPGLACDEGAGTCFSVASVCDSDADCQGNKRCSVAQQECVIPQCERDVDCSVEFDTRWACDVASFSCYLPPAVCEEEDEENDSIAAASPLEDGSYAGFLCRGDTDVLSFPVEPGRRYAVRVDFLGSGQPGITAALLDTSENVESSAVFTSIQSFVELAGVTGPEESGLFWLRITGNNTEADRWLYTVTVTDSEPSAPADCSPEGEDAEQEPNDSFDMAVPLTASVAGTTRVFSRCGTSDVDYFRIPVTAQHGIEVLIGGFYNAEGNINAELFKAPNTNSGSRVDQATGVTDVEALDAPEGPSEFWLKVQLANSSGALDDQRYSVTVKEVPRPAACSVDTNEPADGSAATATVIALAADATPGAQPSGGASSARCNPQDVDHFAFTVPASRSASVRLRFNHSEGNLKLEVLNGEGSVIPGGTSDTSTVATEIDEQVSVPGNPMQDVTYVARVSLSGAGPGIVAQAYTIEVETFDDSVCLASEPEGGNNSFASGVCLGEPAAYGASVLACGTFGPEPLVPTCTDPNGSVGCGLVCGNSDSDYFRVGKLKNDQTLHALLTFDPTLGGIDLVRSSVTSATGTPAETVVGDTDGNGVIELWYVETSDTGKEFAVRVKPKGTTGHEQQPYALTVEVGGECNDDANDTGAGANEKPTQATPLVINPGAPTVVEASRCNNDVDVYELILLAGESVSVSLAQTDPNPVGLNVEIGRRPPDLNTIPTPVVTALAGAEAATFSSDARQVVYLTVRPRQGQTPAVQLTGSYTLTVDVRAAAGAGE